MNNQVTARDVARKAKRIFPIMGRLMEARMRTPAIPIPPVHFHVLNHLETRPYALNELADQMSVSSASLSRTITVLEEREWVTRNRSTEDRRVVQIEITPEGHAVLMEIETRSEDFLAETLNNLSQEDLQTMMDGLEIMIGAFAEAMSYLPSDSDKK